ncbi:hypothetical protein [Gryllotalpicola ginsengisoli]|uniref:hypothetical protein n=1 Tax=Gryllotalpicola ginsengisoli TaxID=444608 RepID=UPI0003B613F7|nr:hypothetical protein [Gryllotalpicola ginsengisoli]
MTAITLRRAQAAPSDRMLERIGIAMVRYARTRSERRARAIRRETALLADQRRRERYAELAARESRLGLR